MAHRAEKRDLKTPRSRTAEAGSFFPNEVVRILRLVRVDYRQLRRLFRLVRQAAGSSATAGRWSRFSFQDLAALRVAIELAGGPRALRKGRRLQLKGIEEACRALRDDYRLTSPLTQARLHREGRTIVADLGGLHFVPQSGQLVFGSLEADCRRHVLVHDEHGVTRSLARLEREQGHLRELRKKNAKKCGRSTAQSDMKIHAVGES
jgi:hypothetical protein